MSEEIRNAALVVPRSIMTTLFINGCMGFGMLMVLLFSSTNVEVAQTSPTGYPFMEIFLKSTGSIAGSSLMASLVTAMQWFANVGILASASRMCWSFARDRGLPGSGLLQHVSHPLGFPLIAMMSEMHLRQKIGRFWTDYYPQVDPRTTLPVRSIMATTTISCVLSLTVLGSSTAFNDLVSLWVASLNSSYLLASGLLLYKRCTGGITPRSSIIDEGDPEKLQWGPWYIPGFYGIINNVFACSYIIVIVFFSLWPPARPVTSANMNYSVLVTGAVIVFSVIYYFGWAKKEYRGPVIEVTDAH